MSRFAALPAATRGILLMLLAILAFTVMDAVAKALSARVDVVQAIWARYAGQTVLVFLVVLPRLKQVTRTNYPKLQFLRSLFLLGATSCFFFGISLLGLAEATAIMDINPVLITLGAAVFLGERFGLRRAFGVFAALIGALIIIRPGSEVFSPYAVLPVAAAVFYTAFALTTRFVGRDEDVWTSLFYTALVGAAVLSCFVPFYWQPPDTIAVLLMLVIGGIGALSQMLLIQALRLAEASLVAPFAYVGLLFATLWGMLFFGEYPDTLTYVGALVIVAAGIYVWHRETHSSTDAQHTG